MRVNIFTTIGQRVLQSFTGYIPMQPDESGALAIMILVPWAMAVDTKWLSVSQLL